MKMSKAKQKLLSWLLSAALILGGITFLPERTLAETTDFEAVTDIVGLPDTAVAGTDLLLNGQVIPEDATNQDITWQVENPGTTGATIINGNILSTTGTGQVRVSATVVSGASITADFVKNFEVSVNEPMDVSGVKVVSFNTAQVPYVTTLTVTMADIGLDSSSFSVADNTVPGSTVTVDSAVYSGDNYTVVISGMNYYDDYTLTIEKEGYGTYTNTSFFGTLAEAADLDLANEPNIFTGFERVLTGPGLVSINNSNYAANARLYSGTTYTAIDSNNGNPDNGTATRLIGVFAKAPAGAKAVKTLRTNGQVLQVTEDSLIDANPNLQETVESGKDYYNNHKMDAGFVDNGYWQTIAFLPMYSQIASERQSDSSRILVDPADRFRIIEWYDNETCTGSPIKVLRLMVEVNYNGSLLTDGGASVLRVLGKTIIAGSQAGTLSEPVTATVSVISSIDTLKLSEITAEMDATVKLYTNAAYTQEITGTDSIPLAAGGETTVYIKVTGRNSTPIKYYKISINRSAITSEVTANDSEELAYYMEDPKVSVINLLSGSTYQYNGGIISRNLTINGNHATIVAGQGVTENIIRSDGVIFYGLGNFMNEKTFLKVDGQEGFLTLNQLTLCNGSMKNGTNTDDDGICAVINIKPEASFEMDGVTLKNFDNNPTEGFKNAFGVHAEPGAGNITIRNSTFDSSNAFRNAVAIRTGNYDISGNTFQGTDNPLKLRRDDGYEYAIYIFGGTGTIRNNNITHYNSTNFPGYSSGGISVIGFYPVDATIENNILDYNSSGIDITGYWSNAGTNRSLIVNGRTLSTSEEAYAIGEAMKQANQQDYVNVSFDQNDEVSVTDSNNNSYYTVLGGYRSPLISVAETQGNTVTIQFPEDAVDIMNAAITKEFEVKLDGSAEWTELSGAHIEWLSAVKAKLTLEAGHSYQLRFKMSHNSYVEENDPEERTLTTYSNPISSPAAPGNVSAVTGDERAVVSFVPPVNNGGSAVTGYQVYVYENGVRQDALTASGSSSPITVTGLKSQTTYTFKVAAVNALGEGVESTSSNEITTYSKSAALSGLLVSGGSLNTAFTSGTNAYTINVAYSISSIRVTPTAVHATATVTVNGNTVLSGQASDAINLSVGPNLVTIQVTAEDGVTTVTYTITVFRSDYVQNSSPDPVPATTPAPGTEIITVDVKQGNTDKTVAQITIERTTEKDGKKTDKVTFGEEKAVETVKALKEEGKDTARIVIPDRKETISETKVTIPAKSIATLSDGKINLQIDTEHAKIDISKTELQSISKNTEEDMYFRLIPVKEKSQKDTAVNHAILQENLVSGNQKGSASIIGSPITIETNMPSTEADITLPLTGITLPSNPKEKAAFLNQLAVYIEHSDGDKELIQGELVEYKEGVYGIRFHIKKFSTFTVVKTNAFIKPAPVKKSNEANLLKVITPAKASVKGKVVKATTGNKTASVTLKLKVSEKATWKLYSNQTCTKLISGNKVKLKEGVNTVYVKITAKNKKTSKVYTVKITRKSPDYKEHIMLGLIGSESYAKQVAKIFAEEYDCKNVAVTPEGKYYRVSLDFIDKAAATKACKDMITRKYIINYYFEKKKQ